MTEELGGTSECVLCRHGRVWKQGALQCQLHSRKMGLVTEGELGAQLQDCVSSDPGREAALVSCRFCFCMLMRIIVNSEKRESS